jgi:hypothetical protein
MSGTKAAHINTGSLAGHPDPQGTFAPETLINCALCTAAALTKQTSGQVNDELQRGRPQSAEALIAYAQKNVSAAMRQNNTIFDYVAHKDLPHEETEGIAGIKELMQDLQTTFGGKPEQDLPDQIIGLAAYVKGKLGTKVACSEWPADFDERRERSPVNLDDMTHPKTAIPFMQTQPVGTKFAVYTSRNVHSGKMPHWSYAEKTDQQIFFADPQLDRSEPLSADFKTTWSLPSTLPPAQVRSDFPLGPNGIVYASEPDIYMLVLAFGPAVRA